MPSRLLLERICTSETLANLSPEEERFFYRLLVQVDDFGRFDARPSVLRARCFALQLDQVTDTDVATWLEGLAREQLVTCYQGDDGRSYLFITTWTRYQRTRAEKSRFPAPPADICTQLPADANIGGHPLQSATSADICKHLPAAANIREHLPADASTCLQMSPEPEPEPDSYPESNPDAVTGAGAGRKRPPRKPVADVAEPQLAPAAAAAIATPPESLSSFDRLLRPLPGYDPSAAFYAAVDRYGAQLDLAEQAVKMTSWIRAGPGRRCTAKFVLDWLARELKSPPEKRNGHVNGHATTAVEHLRPGAPGGRAGPNPGAADRFAYLRDP